MRKSPFTPRPLWYSGALHRVAAGAGVLAVAQGAALTTVVSAPAQAASPPAASLSGPTTRITVDRVVQFDLPQGATFTIDAGSDLVAATKNDGVLSVKALKPGEAIVSITAPGSAPRHNIIRIRSNTAETPTANNGAPLTTDGGTETPVPSPAAAPPVTPPATPAATAEPLPALSSTPKPTVPSALGPIEPSATISATLPPPARLPPGKAPYPTTVKRGMGSTGRAPAQRDAIIITQGLARLMAFNSNILAVFFSDEAVMDARAINARTIAITGKGPGKSTLAVFTQTSPGDVIGRANIYRIEVTSATTPVPVVETALKDPVAAATAIRTALDDPRVDVSVVQAPDGSLAARLTGTVRSQTEVDAAVSTAKLFVPNVIPSLIVDPAAPTVIMAQHPEAVVLPPTAEEILQSKLRQITGNQTIELISLPSGLVIKGEVNSVEEAERLMRFLPPMTSPIMPLLVIRGGGVHTRSILTAEDASITRGLQEATGIYTVYAMRTASNAIAIHGTVRTRREYDAVRRYAQVLPTTIGAVGAAPAGAGATTSPTAFAGGAATGASALGAALEPTDSRLTRTNLPTSGNQLTTQIQNFVEIIDPNEAAVRTVTLETNLVEISRNALRNLGVQVGSASVLSESRTAATAGTVVVAPDGTRTITGGSPATVTRTIDPNFNSGSFLGGNGFAGFGPNGLINPIRVRLDALYRNGNARILSQPNVSAVEGMDAQITIGGERPVPSTSTSASGGSQQTSVEFRRFGVILTMRPTVTDDNSIFLQVRADVTSIDPSTAINLNGAIIPGETVRSVDTNLVVREGDMIAIGGLISNDHRYETSRVPFLSKIPILGELFKSKRFENNETELAIFMQPRIMRLPNTTMGTLTTVLSGSSLPALPGRDENKGPFEALGDNPTQH